MAREFSLKLVKKFKNNHEEPAFAGEDTDYTEK
jgi:hypothetical protein